MCEWSPFHNYLCCFLWPKAEKTRVAASSVIVMNGHMMSCHIDHRPLN